ncbi:hypothetical protein M501DRAFT_944113 [Patellaria atrata CBS 101060]|uniref:Uncharacterized protein n=1 Tax=Patellaria atrata CBS 101060 TaxID=1346257 RepID=A0A9P4S1B1_9PEZI|nr:hypothetical protein M501DRAFT_944113 [Patellaria atrata CBS 101060]
MVRDRTENPSLKAKKEKRTRAAASREKEGDVHRATLKKLIEWLEADNHTGPIPFRQHIQPNVKELLAMASHFFPARSNLQVMVYDLGRNKTELKMVGLNEIEDHFTTKPTWADVRWIHAPLGTGLLHSSVEDLFLKSNRENVTNQGRHSSWPYVEMDCLNFRDRLEIETLQNVYLYLEEYEKRFNGTNKELSAGLDMLAKGHLSDSLRVDVEWRAKHLDVEFNYWEMVRSDLPWHLREGIALTHHPKDFLKPSPGKVREQAISGFPFFKDAHLVRSPFRCFHRPDGYLLTMSAACGVDFLDKNFSAHLEQSKNREFVHNYESDEDASVLNFIVALFRNTGTSTWGKKDPEWLMAYLLSEIAATPHNIRQGRNGFSLQSGYQAVVEKLKGRRYEEFRRNESVKQVTEYLACIDELTTLQLINERKVERLRQLEDSARKAEAEDLLNESASDCGRRESKSSLYEGENKLLKAETSFFRIEWARMHCDDALQDSKRLLLDSRLAMESLFQLRSIEQNERAIVADSQNNAVLVFTGVTIIFLPLSFVTGYFGMNLQGVVDTTKSEQYFWIICGSVSVVIIIVVSLLLLRGRFQYRFRREGMIWHEGGAV